MIEAFNLWLQVPEDDLKVITRVIEMLHSASLLYVYIIRFSHVWYITYRIDDVEDDSILRRGVPAAHHIYGVPQTINCANYVYFLALSELTKLNKPNMIIIYTEELINLHRGQGKHLSFFKKSNPHYHFKAWNYFGEILWHVLQSKNSLIWWMTVSNRNENDVSYSS